VGTKDYNALVCDTNSQCSSVIAGTFTVTGADTTPPSTSVKDVNGDTASPYWARTSADVILKINIGEASGECKWSDTNSAGYASFGTVCTTSGSEASCNIGTRGETTSVSLSTFYNCKDSSGNATGGKKVDFGNDYTKPTGTLSTSISEDDVTLTYSGADAHSGIEKYEARVDSGSWVDKGTGTSHTFSDQGNGDHTYYVRITDKAGNAETKSEVRNVNFNASSTPGKPTISSDTHEEDEWTTDNDPEFGWTEVSNTDEYRYALNQDEDYDIDEDDSDNGTSRARDFTDRADGTWWFHVAACNDEGCGTTDHYRIRIDTTGPGGVGNFFGLSQSDGSIYLSWDEPEDDGSGVAEYVVYRNIRQQVNSRDFRPNDPGVRAFEDITSRNFTDESGLSPGLAYYYRIQAVDEMGNLGTLSAVKRVLNSADACGISISFDLPEIVKAGELEIKANVDNGEIFEAELKVKMPGQGYETLSIGGEGPEISDDYTIPLGITGTATVLISGEDENGKPCEGFMEFGVDSIAPELDIVSPDSGSEASGTATITVSASDEGSGIGKVEAFVGGQSAGVFTERSGNGGNYVLEWNSSSKQNGTYDMEISAEDAAGNKTLGELTVVVRNIEGEFFGEEEYAYNESELDSLLRQAGLKEEVAEEAKRLISDNKPERKIVLTRTDSGIDAEVMVSFTATTVTTLQIIEVIPKGVVDNARNITSGTNFAILQDDPAIRFDLGSVSEGQRIEMGGNSAPEQWIEQRS